MEVWRKQCLLAYVGLLPYQDIDDIWGDQTQGATEAFQNIYQMKPVDGIFGDDTLEKILDVIHSREEPAPDISVGDKMEPTDKDVNVPTKTGTFWDEIEGFDHEEFRCTCGGRGCTGFPVEPHEQLVRNLADTRKHFDRIVPISSGVRCALRNSELPGSASNSLHMRGKAADFAVTGLHSSVTLAYIRTLPHVDEAYAIDDSYVHMGVLEYD